MLFALFKKGRALFIFMLLSGVCCLYAQTPPCGIAVIRTEGPKVDERFVAAPPAEVKTAVVKALPALAAKVHKDNGLEVEAKTDTDLYESLEKRNQDAGIHGMRKGLGAMGTFTITIRETTQDGVSGSTLHIEFHKNAMSGRIGNEGYAEPLADETVCLVKVLSFNDLSKNPRGLALTAAAPARGIALPEATEMKVLLPESLYSKKLSNKDLGQSIRFEVAEDVVVEDTVVVRRGALATGHLTDLKKGKSYGRNAAIDFAFDTVTAVDGQTIPLVEASEETKGARHNDTAGAVMSMGAFGFMIQGASAFVRAGTSYDVETSGAHTVQAGH
ncbi:MAG TPA: hypothetical protein VFB10_00365 [Candidatus Dormibacteraeota bacterium]|nr:hypothetical protein [Candidatus Dormibacteraeota bacterium]